MAWRYCEDCKTGMDPPTLRQALTEEYDCPQCGSNNDTLGSTAEAFNELIDMLEGMQNRIEALELKVTESSSGRPNPLFEVWTADSVAECLTGVPEELYSKLWNEIVPLQPENQGDNYNERCLAAFWAYLDTYERVLLNKLAEEEDARNNI